MMILGKWNKSVIITYLGVVFSIMGMFFALTQKLNYSICCLIITGICDLFDGVVARKCKRTEEEKEFGVQLDSLADVFNFIAFPIVIFVGKGYTNLAFVILYSFFAVCGIARLGYFNIKAISNVKTDYYDGLPVTYTALILPLIYLLNFIVSDFIFMVVFSVSLGVIAVLNILNIKIKKPRGIAYIIFSAMAVFLFVIYLVVL